MRLSVLLVALPALAVAAQDQASLKDKASSWFGKAKAATPPNPVDAAASKIAESRVHKFTHANYDQKLRPSSQDPADGPEDWLVFVTGGNKTCFGRCGPAELAWNESVPLFAALPKKPHLGFVDCERHGLLCTTWAASVPSLWLFQVPVPGPDQSQARTPLYIKSLNWTTTTFQDIVTFYAKKEYQTTITDPKTGEVKEKYRYDGIMHPINGQLKVFGLLHPIGYILWGFGQVPSFVIMIGISFISRHFMGRRMANRPDTAAAGGGAGAAPPAAARPATAAKKNK